MILNFKLCKYRLIIAPNKTQVKRAQRPMKAKPNENRVIKRGLPIRGFRKTE